MDTSADVGSEEGTFLDDDDDDDDEDGARGGDGDDAGEVGTGFVPFDFKIVLNRFAPQFAGCGTHTHARKGGQL